MTDSPRRRFLHLTGASLTALLAGCSDNETGGSTTKQTKNSSKSTETTGTGTPTETGTETTTTEQKPTLHTKYDSREKFASPGMAFDAFGDLSNWHARQGEMTPDTKTKYTGSQSLRMVGRDGRHVILERQLSETMDFTDRDVSVMFRTTTPDKIGFYIYLVDTNGNKAALELHDVTYRKPDIGWFRTCPGVFKVDDEKPDLSSIDRILL